MITKQDLAPWMRNTPYLWWAVGATALIATIPVYIVTALWDERKVLTNTLGMTWDLMTYNVKDETDD